MSIERIFPGQIDCTCQQCGRTFFKFPAELKRGEGTACSRHCFHQYRAKPKADRFWSKVKKTETCWLWTGACKGGKWPYGILGTPVKGAAPESAHRVSWELHYGPIPAEMKVLHRCDNPPCVNPEHLFLGTMKDNTQDMLQKRRHKEKLWPAQIAEIIQRYRAGGLSQQQLAKEYGVGQVTISRKLNQQ
jgi:hypothetical protein